MHGFFGLGHDTEHGQVGIITNPYALWRLRRHDLLKLEAWPNRVQPPQIQSSLSRQTRRMASEQHDSGLPLPEA